MEFSLSVVIPNYNNEKFIELCILSVLNQSYDNLKEIIIVDDASTDNSKEIIINMSKIDERIKPIFLQRNGKVSHARNQGLKAVTSEYITFLDGDDYYYNSDKLKNEMSLIINYAKDDKDVAAYSKIVRVSNDNKEIMKSHNSSKRPLEGRIYSKLLLGIGMDRIMRDYCIKTNIIKKIGGYNETNSFFEDYELILKLAKKVKFYSTLNNGTAYRDSINGLSKKTYDEQLESVNRISFEEIRRNSFPMNHLYKVGRYSLFIIKNIAKKILYIFHFRN